MRVYTNLTITLLTLLLTLGSGLAFGQNAKTFIKDGKKLMKAADYKNAINEFTKAIELDDDLIAAYSQRAECHEKLDHLELAAADFHKAAELDKKNKELWYDAGRMFNKTGDYSKAIDCLTKATELSDRMTEAHQEKVVAYMSIRDFYNANAASEEALQVTKSAKNYFNKAWASDSLHKYDDAAKYYKKAMSSDKQMEEAHVGYAMVNVRIREFETAEKTCEKLLETNPNNAGCYVARGAINYEKGYFQKAINDLSKVTQLQPENIQAYMIRARYYREFNQHVNAISDYTQVLKLDEKYYQAYYMRAQSYEALNKYELAIKDYEQLQRLAPYDEKAQELYKEAVNKLFELYREEDIPKFSFTVPKETMEKHGAVLDVPMNADRIDITGSVTDASPIKVLRINGKDIEFPKDTLNPFYCGFTRIEGKDEFVVEVIDVYDNRLEKHYTIRRTEINPPVVTLIAPPASDHGEIYLDSNSPSLYVEGKIEDESLIESIVVEGANASFVFDRLNPKFSATIDIANKDAISVICRDVYGNEITAEYTLNREGAIISESNPMGKTWAVFIQNSDYEEFASLDGPEKDITTMRSALSNYEVHNVLVKKNMTKSELDRFFSIELRDLVRANHVRSILLWYAGHGKFINETGYWIPVDAERDDEFSYYSIANLKAGMQGYANELTHTLVVTDACESGPSFFQAMRATNANRRCDDYTATHFKSSQVFSSSGYDLAADKSQFTKTFASSLKVNPDYCIPIDRIVDSVSDAVEQTNQQKPEFGTIQGLEDENGTFFFIKKE